MTFPHVRHVPEPHQRSRHVTADVANDIVRNTKKDAGGTNNYTFATGGTLAMAHIPQMYSLTDLYFQAALERADATRLNLQRANRRTA